MVNVLEPTWLPPHTLAPAVLGSPFDELGPPELARKAAWVLQRSLPASTEGKMYGVLVVREATGRLGVVCAFSGQLAGRWQVPGFAPPWFDHHARHRVEPAGELAVKRATALVDRLREAPPLAEHRAALSALQQRQAADRQALRERHQANRRARHAEREQTGPRPELDQRSRADKAELRRADEAWALELTRVEGALAPLERRLRAAERLRRFISQRVMRQLFDTYQVPSFSGRRQGLLELFAAAGRVPPSGTGDCAAPKLLAFAIAHRLQPVALAEFWWGPPPAGGGRVQGTFYPACTDKCGPLLPLMLEGVEVSAPRRFAPPRLPSADLELVYQDLHLLVLDKPPGLLSVPGTDASVDDSVLARLRRRYPHALGPLLVHRLDLDTSGLLLVALDPDTYRALQRQFLQRTVSKRYVAWLEGELPGEQGTIDAALRGDLDDRPRQLVDPVYGKRAVTRWQVLERRDGRTRVALWPLTGRTHQLRVHAAHPRGLDAPIVGDRLYGHAAERLLLHAEALEFEHPVTGVRLRVERQAPF